MNSKAEDHYQARQRQRKEQEAAHRRELRSIFADLSVATTIDDVVGGFRRLAAQGLRLLDEVEAEMEP
jgi:hypothetical protein